LALARLRHGPAPQQEFALFLAADKRNQPARVQCLEAVLLRTFPQRRICARLPDDALEVLRSEIAEFEKVAEKLARALGDDDAVRRGDTLQPGGQVWRVADDAALLCLSRAQEIADDHNPGRNPHPHVQRRAGGGLKLRRGLDDCQPSSHCALRVVLVRLRIAEIGEHSVAHVLGDEAPIALDHVRAALVIGPDDPPHVLGIEPSRHRCRTYEIAEHHRKLTALGGVLRLRRGLGIWPTLDRPTSGVFQCGDCVDQPPAVPQEDAKLFEIGFCQLEQDVGINSVVAERRFILAEPQAS
jgi:hypothetical protein